MKEIGGVCIYGSWDDTYGRQFAVIWGEAGPHCTVLIFSGSDYGGGISLASSRVPVKDAEEIVDIVDEYERYINMEALVSLYKEDVG